MTIYPMKLKYSLRTDGESYNVYVDQEDNTVQKDKGILHIDYNEIIQISTLVKIMITYI